jgi:hypothetical protein
MPQAAFRIDQVGLPTGDDDRSRSDGLDTGAEVTLTSLFPGTTNIFKFLWTPDEDTNAVSSLVNYGSYSKFSPSPGVYGTYRIQLTVKTGGIQRTVIRTFAIRTPVLGLRKPALGERASETASLENQSVKDSETNEESTGRFSSGNYGGWYSAYNELVDALEDFAGTPTVIPEFVYSPATLSTEDYVFSTFADCYAAARAFINAADGIATVKIILGGNVALSSSAWNFQGIEFESYPNTNATISFTATATMSHPPASMKNVNIDSLVAGALCTLGAGTRSIHLIGSSYISSSIAASGGRVFALTAGTLSIHCEDSSQIRDTDPGNFADLSAGAQLNVYLKDDAAIVTSGGSSIFFSGAGATIKVFLLGGWVSASGFFNQDPLSTTQTVQLIQANAREYQRSVTIAALSTDNYSLFTNGSQKVIRLDVSGFPTVTVTGILADSESIKSDHVLLNVSTSSIVFSHNSGSSSAGNKIFCDNSRNMTVPPNGAARLFYDHASQAWRLHPLGMPYMATNTFKGRITGSDGPVEDLTATQATSILNPFTGDGGSGGLKGLVPAPASGDAAKFLKGDGTWAAGATGTVTSVSVVSANGISGSVANPSSTPAITLSTSFWLAKCKYATTGNITLSGAQTIDGQNPTTNDRILVWRQTTRSANGIYLYNSAGAWTRATDFNASSHIIDGIAVRVTNGDTLRGSYHLAATGAVTLGTDSLFWLKNEAYELVVSATSYTILPEDLGASIKFTSASAVTVTANTLATMGIGKAGQGKAVALLNFGGGQVTVSAGDATRRYDTATFTGGVKTKTAQYSPPILLHWVGTSDLHCSGGMATS